MKKLIEVDLSAEPKKRVYKKRKVEEDVVREVVGVKSLPVKEKKAPTEKQLAARERMKQARLAKIEQVKAEKAKLDEEIRLKQEEVERKKAELAEKRRLKREEKKNAMPQLPIKTSDPGKTGDIEPPQPTISETLASLGPNPVKEVAEVYPCSTDVRLPTVPETPKKEEPVQKTPDAPKREYFQRFRSFPYGKSIPVAPRFR